ncbi:hypothetical protein HMPREF1624_02614 [Sporothrix schenckii ATCC 58251]|uniref:TATA-binding protein interacting (TIP20) domain-containing protein n=1 Tax=Sporothrix schenckii (strain ATCC 58251 / de Perez 2211183) TaxID=1391915 RepID=U7Q0D2_SPOS1|nr:hypothetical protein HMPREF1624_02614 [Sporothrix schenckii ATCC 58251]
MTTINPHVATSSTISGLLQKLGDSDPDFRFMSLNDLLLVLVNGRPEILQNDYNVASKTVDHLVRALDDQNGEVQNLAIKCLGPLVHRLPLAIIATLMEKLTALRLKNSVDNTVPAMALKAVVVSLPAPAPGEHPTKDNIDAYSTINRVLIPRFIGLPTSSKVTTGSRTNTHHQRQVAASQASGGAPESILDINANPTAESVDVLIEVVRCFGPMLQVFEVEALQEAVFSVLHGDRGNSAVKKRAVVAASILAVYLSEDALTKFITMTVQALNRPSSATQRLYISILGSMARSIPLRFGRHIGAVIPFILHALNEEELEKQLEAISDGNDPSDFNDVREAALVALDAFLASCPNQMRPYTDETMQACLRYVKYDPNYVGDDDDMEDADDEGDEDDDFGGDEDDEFDADAGFDDDDDASWKVRRCAAKAIHTLISTRSSGDLLDNGVLYRDAAPLLIKRFEEREETVRLEVISAVSLLVRKTGEGIIPEFSLDSLDSQSESGAQLPLSRKRRRQSSVTALPLRQNSITSPTSPTLERRPSIPTTGPRADLAEQTRSIVTACTKILKGKQVPTKQAAINLLNDIVSVQRGGLSDYFEQVLDLVLVTVKSPTASAATSSLSLGGGNASATPTTLRIAALRLVGHIANTHSSQVLQPYLARVVDAVLTVVSDRFYKLSAEAVSASEEVIKSITPPRSRSTAAAKFKPEIQKLYDVLMNRATASNVDTEVRTKAIQALGTLLSRTGAEGASLLALEKRSIALESLLELLGNETSRLAAVRAIDVIAASATTAVPFDGRWTRRVTVHLASQLGKANHSLRSSCIHALRHLVQSPAAQGELDDTTIPVLVTALYPVISRNDQRLLSPTLRILKVLVEIQPQLVVTAEVIESICHLLQSSVAATVLDPLLQLVTVIGRSGHGGPLMKGLLRDVGVVGDPAIVGKVVGNLLVASGSSAGVTIDSFIKETQTFKADQVRASLALSVLGEAGLRLGKDSPIQPELFVEQFTSDYDKVSISAAVALGRAGAGNVPLYVPVILQGMESGSSTQYLLLQSIKEVLQQVTIDHTDISEYTAVIWDKLLQMADVENNKAACAECIGRLAITAPETYIPRLHSLLGDQSAVLRAISVQAIRYALPDTGEAFDTLLREHLVAMLNKALSDKDMEIRRLAMTALNSAANNKPELILGHLNELLPYIMEESKPKPELVREVMMGPFKHLVDDGLEVRKGAYETLYALMETAFSRISIISLFDRIIDGLGDEHDIRAMCTIMVSRLAYIAPEETTRHLNSIADKFRATLSNKLKDNAVKQEHEKQEDANKSVLRATLLLADRLKAALNDGSSTVDVGAHQTWTQYWEWVNRAFEAQLRTLRSESRDKGAAY